MSEIEIQSNEALYFSEALERPTYRLFRKDGGDTRWYYRPDTDRFYASVTSIIKSTMPTPYPLIQWMIKNGSDHEDIRDERASYGTWLHIQLASLLINGEYDLDTLESQAELGVVGAGLDPTKISWYDDAKKDILSFAQFVADHQVSPIAIEIMLSSSDGYAGAVDLVCEMNIGTGQNGSILKRDGDGERITAIVDVKSGKKGFWESHEIQLHMYWKMWSENFPDTPVSRLFNWAPKDWRSSPTFSLKDQTESSSAAKIPHLLSLFDIDSKGGPPSRLVVGGKITPGCDLGSCYRMENVREKMREYSALIDSSSL